MRIRAGILLRSIIILRTIYRCCSGWLRMLALEASGGDVFISIAKNSIKMQCKIP